MILVLTQVVWKLVNYHDPFGLTPCNVVGVFFLDGHIQELVGGVSRKHHIRQIEEVQAEKKGGLSPGIS